MTKEFRNFSIFNTFHVAAISAVTYFGILNIYQLSGESLLITGLSFAGIFLPYPFLLAIFTSKIGQLGTRRSMQLGELLFIISLLPLFFIEQRLWLIIPWLLIWNLSRVFFNTAWRYQMSMLTTSDKRGSEIALYIILTILTEAITPLLASVFATLLGISGVALLAILLTFGALIFLQRSPDYKFYFSGYLLRFFKIARLQNMLAIVGINDAQNFLNVFWHIWIFVLLGGSFLKTGYLLAFTVVVSTILSYIFGEFLDHHNRKGIFRYEALINAALWLLRYLATSVGAVLAIDVFYKLNKNIKDEAVEVVSFDVTSHAEQQLALDEKIILRELLANVIISLSVLVGLIFALLFGLKAPLLLAAVISMLFLLV